MFCLYFSSILATLKSSFKVGFFHTFSANQALSESMAAASSSATVMTPSFWMLGGRVAGSIINFRMCFKRCIRSVPGQTNS